MDTHAAPRNGDFHAIDKLHAELLGALPRLRQTSQLVMIGERDMTCPIACGARHQDIGCECAVGCSGVTMKIKQHGLFGGFFRGFVRGFPSGFIGFFRLLFEQLRGNRPTAEVLKQNRGL